MGPKGLGPGLGGIFDFLFTIWHWHWGHRWAAAHVTGEARVGGGGTAGKGLVNCEAGCGKIAIGVVAAGRFWYAMGMKRSFHARAGRRSGLSEWADCGTRLTAALAVATGRADETR